jgi:hypothetical protein
VTLGEDYQAIVRQAVVGVHDVPEMLPLVLVQACVAMLPIDGAGLSLTQELRVPLSATSELVTRAERLQTTLGEGPCLTVAGRREPLVADLAGIATGWPVFHHELLRQTPFRSVASLPLVMPDGHTLGAVDLYSRDASAAAFAVVPEIGGDVAAQMATFLMDSTSWLAGSADDLAEDDSGAVTRRMNVWVAIGMVMERGVLTNVDALALLRASAFSRDVSLDDLAEQLTSRELGLDALVGQV